MNVLIVGAGGREHAMSWKISQSSIPHTLFFAPGNAGTASLGTNTGIAVDDFNGIKKIVLTNSVSLVVVGPEDPLVKGIHDFFLEDSLLRNIPVIGPRKYAASLEGSKEFAKEFMIRHNIPTAEHFSVTISNLEEGKKFLEKQKSPFVLKADGLAAGKGVLILDSLDEAKSELEKMLKGKFGSASSKVVIEEYLSGIELSIFVLTDGRNYLVLPEAKDYKRIGNGDTGLNTGGMGAVSPVPFANKDFLDKVHERIIKPTIQGLKNDNIPYKGFIFIGLMNTNGDPKVIEYNVRMGDPESEVVFPRIKSDLLELLIATGENKLGEKNIELHDGTFVTVMAVSGGYPEEFKKGDIISGLDLVSVSNVFHAGTKFIDGNICTNGGRVLAVTSHADTLQGALNKSYESLKNIHYNNIYFRTDIGFDLK